jgi:hypothetical protein
MGNILMGIRQDHTEVQKIVVGCKCKNINLEFYCIDVKLIVASLPAIQKLIRMNFRKWKALTLYQRGDVTQITT